MRNGLIFQPTRPLRGATNDARRDLENDGISTHAPLAGRDHYLMSKTEMENKIFQPTRPLRGATRCRGSVDLVQINISTHAPLAGRDNKFRNVLLR